jgi:hypothetical protein
MNLHEEITQVAYELYETRGCIYGCDLDDWLEAEEIVLAKHAGQELEEPEEEDDLGGEAAGETTVIEEIESKELNEEES